MLKLLLGERGGISEQRMTRDVARERLSDYLPWVAYDHERKTYLSQEGAQGSIWECMPLPFMTEKTADILGGILRLAMPPDTVIQFILFADPDVKPFTDLFERKTHRPDPLLNDWAAQYAEFLRKGAMGLDRMSGIPTRMFRLLVSIKAADGLTQDTVNGVQEFLRGAGLHAEPLAPQGLLRFLRCVVGGEDAASVVYDPARPIRRQVIRAEDEISIGKESVKIGARYAKCLTPKVMPSEIDLLKMNQLFGGVMGMSQDTEQVSTPFLYCLTVLPEPVSTNITAKAELMSAQKAAGGFVAQLRRRLDEYAWALGEMDKTTFMRIVPTLWVFADTEERLRNSSARVRRMWESRGFVMQEERWLQSVLLVASLPMGLYNVKKNVDLLDRHFIVPLETVARMIPAQADFRGGGDPVLAYVGRKGQLIGLDIFDRGASNHNILVAAQSGGGKSVFMQNLLTNHYRTGAMCRVIDIGYSYQKLTALLKGRYIDLGDEAFVLNPFDGVTNESDAVMARAVIAQMAYSHRAGIPTETEWTLIGAATEWAIAKGDPERGVELAGEFLKTFPKHSADDISESMDHVIRAAHTLAYNMRDFMPGGRLARYVSGRSSVDISHDEWVVLELEHLMSDEALFAVVTLMIIHKVTADLYLGSKESREHPRFILFDEAWKFLSATAGAKDSPVQAVIEEGYRRARKYKGSFSIVTQSLVDTRRFGAVGEVIRNNSAFKFLLESSDYGQARAEGMLEYDDFAMRLIQSVKLNRPKYSEIMLDTPFGLGVGRLSLDPYSYWLFTSDATDNLAIQRKVASGMTYVEAIRALASEAA